MAKHSGEKRPRVKSAADKSREDNLKKFEVLSPKAMKHIEESLEAVQPCSYCDKDGNATKKDFDGKCANCHGTGSVPDVRRRDWAAEEVTSRVAPKPKPVEMTVDDKSDFEEFEKELSGKSAAEIDEMLADLGVKVSGSGSEGTGGKESPSS